MNTSQLIPNELDERLYHGESVSLQVDAILAALNGLKGLLLGCDLSDAKLKMLLDRLVLAEASLAAAVQQLDKALVSIYPLMLPDDLKNWPGQLHDRSVR